MPTPDANMQKWIHDKNVTFKVMEEAAERMKALLRSAQEKADPASEALFDRMFDAEIGGWDYYALIEQFVRSFGWDDVIRADWVYETAQTVIGDWEVEQGV